MNPPSPLNPPDDTLLVARHPIQVVANRTGLSMHILRAWERRYGAIKPQRSAGNRRLYSEEDVKRLSLLKRATTEGRRIGDVAHLSLQSLMELGGTDEQSAEFPITPPKGSNLTDTARHVGAFLASIETPYGAIIRTTRMILIPSDITNNCFPQWLSSHNPFTSRSWLWPAGLTVISKPISAT